MVNFYLKKIFLLMLFVLKIISIQAQNTKNIDVETFYDLEMPPFGQFRMSGIIDIQNFEFILKGSPKKNKYNFGLLTIENPFIQVTNKKGFGVQANVTIFNQKAILGILEFKPGKRIIYNITPANVINIPITPWQTVTINNLTLLITPKTMELGATIQAFNKPNLIKFGINRPNQIESEDAIPTLEETESLESPNNYAEIILKEIKPADILSYLSNSEFNNIEINNARFRIDNPFSKTAEHTITIECIINLEKLNLPLLTNITQIKSLIKIDKTTGISIETKVPDTTIMENSQLSDISLQIIIPPKITTQQTEESTSSETETQSTPAQRKQIEKPSIFLSGIANLDLPLVGKISSNFSSTYEKGVFNFETQLDKEVNFEKIFTLKNVALKYSSQGNFQVTGQTSISGLDLIGTLKFSKTPPKSTTPTSQPTEDTPEQQTAPQVTQENQQTQNQTSPTQEEETNPTKELKYLKIGQYFVEFSAKSLSDKPIKPFKNIISIKQIADIEISNPGIGMRPDKTFYITGQTNILNFKSNVQLEIKSKNEITLKSNPPQKWRLSQAIKGLKNTLFDELDLSDIKIIVTTFPHFDPELGITLNKGFNLLAEANLSGGKFAGAKNLFSTLDQKLKLAGSFGDSVSDIYFSVALPVKELNLSDKAVLQNVSFFLSGEGPAIGLKAQILIKPSKEDNELLFTGSIAIDTATSVGGGTLSATLQGEWPHPLGIKGINLSDVAVEGTLPGLTNLGFTGTLLIGKNKKIIIGSKYSVDGQIVLLGEYQGKILLEDLIGIILKSNPNTTINKFKDKFPDIGFQDILFKFAPLAAQIGEISFDPGISLKGSLIILNKTGKINLNLSSEGIFAQGSLDKFKLGPIEINGSGLDGIPNTYDDGPVIDFVLSPETQHLILSGLIDLKILKGQADIHLNSDAINIYLLGNLFNLFETTLEAYSVGSIKQPDALDFLFKAQATNEINEYLIEQITKKLTIFEKSTDKITQQQTKINNLKNEIKNKTNSIKKINNEIKKLKDEYQKLKAAKEEYK